jgi:phage I-like protein
MIEQPKTMRLIPAGSFAGRETRESWINDRPEELLRATRAFAAQLGGRLVLDYDHATDFAAPQGRPAPAAAWLFNFRLTNAELWADGEWTEAGAHAVASGEWAYLSPVFDFSRKDRRVMCFPRRAHQQSAALQDGDRPRNRTSFPFPSNFAEQR